MKALKHIKLIDGNGGEPLEDGVLLIKDGKIDEVGKFGEVVIPDNIEELDLTGKIVIPGLIDSHLHLCFDPVGNTIEQAMKESDAMTALRGVRNALTTLRSGVTTVRDMGGKNHIDLELRNAIDSGLISGPRILASGQILAMTGGQAWPVSMESDGVDELRKNARKQIKAGVNLVKIIATGGILTDGVEPGAPQLTEEEMRAAVEEVNKAGKLTAAHAQGKIGIKNAIRAGVTSIEHGFYLDEEAISMMIDRNVYLVPTLAATYWILNKGREAGVPEHIVSKTEKVIDDHLASFRLALKSGVKIAMGTDAGTPFNEHGKNYYELLLMVEQGMSHIEAITAATKTGAELLGIDNQVGTIDCGKRADLLILNKDPLSDILALNDIYKVLKDGEEVL